MATAMHLAGALRVRALARAFQITVDRHEILRSAIVERQSGVPVQIGQRTIPPVLRIVDLSTVAARAQDALARRLVRRASRQSFDLASGLLIRVLLIRLDAETHVLATAMHHAAGDAWSLDVLMREVTTLYGTPAAVLPPLPIQYGDYAAWEREPARAAAHAAMLEYWAAKLDGVASLDLPTDHPRPAAPSVRGASMSWWVAPAVADRLRRLADGERATVFMVVLAAFATVLRRYTHQDDMPIGSPLALRHLRETATLIGPFLNTLVFRLDARARQPFREFLAHVRDTVIDGLARAHVPFERVVQQLRDAGRPRDLPLFNVLIASRPAARADISMPGLTVRRLMAPEQAAQFDLTLYLGRGPDGLAGVLNYRTELFESTTIARMQGHLTTLLRGIAEAPDTTLQDLPLLTDEEQRQILDQGRGPDSTQPAAAAGVHELFGHQAALRPDAIAVMRDDASVSYGEIERRASALAALLRMRGAGPGMRVAFCLDRQPLLIVAWLGILKSGACYLPLDPALPVRRLLAILTDARPALLLTTTRFMSWWEGTDAIRLDLDTLELGPALAHTRQGASGWARDDRAPDDPASVIYTSGSTGTPKGVAVSHRALLNACDAVVQATRIEPGDRFLHFAPIAFDVSAFQIFPALITGATTVLAAPPDELTNDEILAHCEQGLTILDLASASWQQWIADMAARSRRLPASVRVFMTGGESTPAALIRTWAGLVDPGAVLISSYGPTETTVTTMWIARADEANQLTSASLPLGRPVHNVAIAILDDSGQLVPVGVTGELCVSGVGVSHGYVNRPDEMADRFRPDPFTRRPGARVYRTGDRVRRGADGSLAFRGRFDRQIKRHGIRVEIGEIERLLQQHPQVQAALVTPMPADDPDAPLVAYIVATDPAPGEMAWRQHLLARLPAAVLPDAFCVLSSLPVSANGKIDRRALPMPTLTTASRAARPTVAARSQTEQLVIDIWAAVLGRSGIEVDDDFFDVGGHSLSAARVAAQLGAACGVAVPVRSIFDASTPRQLARLIDGKRQADRAPEIVPPLRPVAREGPIEVSFAQQGFWLRQQLDPDGALFVNLEAVRLHGPLSVPALARSLTSIVTRHEALRTAFIVRAGRPQQLVEPPHPVPVPLVDLRQMPAPTRERAAHGLARQQGRRAFDLTRSPLLRVTVLRVAEDEHLVLFAMHHLAADGWSMTLLMEELSAGGADRPPLELQYGDYAVWQRTRWSEDVLDRIVDERRARWGGQVTELELPTDRPRQSTPSRSGARHRLRLGDAATLVTEVTALARREGVTMFMTLLAALKALLHVETGQRTIVVAAPAANRTLPGTERLIGLFINHLLLATRIDGDPSGRDLLALVRASTLDAFDHQDLPFEELVRRLRPGRLGSHTPLARVMFNLVHMPSTRPALQGLRVEPAPFSTGHRPRFDFEWTFVVADGAITGTIGYDRALFEPSTIERLSADYLRVLRTFVDAPDQPLSTLTRMTTTQASLALAFNDPL